MERPPTDAHALDADAVPTTDDGLPRAIGSLDDVFLSNGIDRERCERDGLIVGRDARLILRGWAANSGSDAPVADFSVMLDGRRVASSYGSSRSDVANAFDNPKLQHVGFHAVVRLEALAEGRHEITIVTRDEPRAVARYALASLHFEVDAAKTSRTLRANTAGLFVLELEQFSAENTPPDRGARIERDFIAILRGRLRETGTGTRAASLHALIDDYDAVPAQLGLATPGDTSDGFTICFPSHDLALGRHEIALAATDRERRMEMVSRLSFSVVPICCGPSVPIASAAIGRAGIDWYRVSGDGGTGYIRGWAIDPITNDAAGKAFLAFPDGRRIALRMRQYRDDVADVDDGRVRFCGFTGSIALEAFDTGSHTARVVIESKDGARRHVTDAVLEFTVRR